MKKLLFGLCALLIASGSQAQSFEDSNLKGFRQFFIFKPVITKNDDADSCGVKADDIDTAIRFVLQQSRIEFNEKKFDFEKPVAFLSANLTFLFDRSLRSCAFVYAIDVSAGVQIASTRRMGTATIWSRSGVATGPAGGTSRHAANAIEDVAKQLVVAWSSAN
jgi:hypothetical protein